MYFFFLKILEDSSNNPITLNLTITTSPLKRSVKKKRKKENTFKISLKKHILE